MKQEEVQTYPFKPKVTAMFRVYVLVVNTDKIFTVSKTGILLTYCCCYVQSLHT